jgi:nicotinamide mononucleotide transporter
MDWGKAAEWTAVGCGLLFLFLTIRENRTGWLFGGFSTGIFAFIMFDAKLFAEMGLNIFYTLMAVKGWFDWGKPEKATSISRLSVKEGLFLILFIPTICFTMGTLLDKFMNAESPFTDSFVSATAIAATWLSIRKKLENWPIWIISNGVAIFLFIQKNLSLTAMLTSVYFILAVAGWVTWNRKWKNNR